ncbi:Dual specificity phosphatase ibp1 [Lentinula edodes]|uniref:Dual specificity phosphatase ibp1 n=1 Tax=Lentinula edodes TaxID=5353 RepID=A0A1Q3EH00_LENED|nr:Dual specificity phosphatase ibp1 [Lentinula edodes]
MPKDLPGFYFDTQKNRYFPLSSRPSTSPQSTLSRTPSRSSVEVDPSTTPRTISRHTRSAQTLNQRLLSSPVSHCRPLVNHDIQCTRVASTSRFDFSQTASFGDITEFCVSLRRLTTVRHVDTLATTKDGSTHVLYSPSAQTYMWPAEINLHSHSQVSSIKISGQKCVATCFGPVTKVAVQDLHVSGRTTLITLNQVHDVRVSHLQDNALILGAKGKAVYIPDIDISGSVQHLSNFQNSDVFALDRDENFVYTGLRNGSILRHDLRVSSNKHDGQLLFHSRFTPSKNSTSPSPVLYLKLVKDSQLLVSRMNGELCTYDTRFPVHSTPSQIFTGHRNSVTQKLGICIDPMHEFLFAAGEDRCIRGWSLRTGKALHGISSVAVFVPTSTSRSSSSSTLYPDLNQFRNPFNTEFPTPIPTMQVTEESDGSLCLWAGMNMALVVPGNHSDIIPPPPQNPPTIEDVGRARLYETTMNFLRLQCGTLANAPTDAECGEVTRYALAVVAQNALVAPAWFNSALQVALQPILQAALQPILHEVQGLRNDVQDLRNGVQDLRNDVQGLCKGVQGLRNDVDHV